MAASIFPFLTDAQFDQLVANGLTARAQADFDPLSVVKLFTPDAGATWLLSEIDLEDPDIAFTLCDLGMGFAELGCVSLAELAGLRGMLGLPIEQDLRMAACCACDAPIARRFLGNGGRDEVACAFIASARDACA